MGAGWNDKLSEREELRPCSRKKEEVEEALEGARCGAGACAEPRGKCATCSWSLTLRPGDCMHRLRLLPLLSGVRGEEGDRSVVLSAAEA